MSLRKQDAVANINEVDGPKGEGQDALSQPSGFVHTALSRNANGPNRDRLHFLAERVGFEPTVRYKRTPDFESGTFDHSATSP